MGILAEKEQDTHLLAMTLNLEERELPANPMTSGRISTQVTHLLTILNLEETKLPGDSMTNGRIVTQATQSVHCIFFIKS